MHINQGQGSEKVHMHCMHVQVAAREVCLPRRFLASPAMGASFLAEQLAAVLLGPPDPPLELSAHVPHRAFERPRALGLLGPLASPLVTVCRGPWEGSSASFVINVQIPNYCHPLVQILAEAGAMISKHGSAWTRCPC